MFLFRKHLRNESVFETKVRSFLFLKRFFSRLALARMGQHACLASGYHIGVEAGKFVVVRRNFAQIHPEFHEK